MMTVHNASQTCACQLFYCGTIAAAIGGSLYVVLSAAEDQRLSSPLATPK